MPLSFSIQFFNNINRETCWKTFMCVGKTEICDGRVIQCKHNLSAKG